jgi:hypothetical protein
MEILYPILLIISVLLLPRTFFYIRRRVRYNRERKQQEAIDRKRKRDFDDREDYRTRQRKREASNELDIILKDLISDWTNNRFKDKVDIISSDTHSYDDMQLMYRFENGDSIKFDSTGYDNVITMYKNDYTGTTYTVGYSHWSLFVSMLTVIVSNINNNRATTRGWRQRNDNSGQQRRTRPKTNTTTHNPNEDHPKWERYWSLIITIRQRTTNLNKMDKDNSDRPNLINELNATKRRAKAMKEKYNF